MSGKFSSDGGRRFSLVGGTGSRSDEAGSKPPVDPPSGGGDDGGMNERLATLEARFDAVLPTLATKADLQGAVNDLVKWIVVTAVGLGVAGITVMTFVLNNAVPKAPAPVAQAPIIITVPAAPQLAPPASR